MSKTKIELLAPAGSLATFKAGVVSGADSIYLGLPKFNAREYAKNFTEDYLKEALKIAKSSNVKIFLTANTLIKNSELKEFFEQIKYAYEQGIYAVIIQDPAFIETIRKSFPGLHIHISTQAGVMNSLHANLFKEADRINLARELSKENIASIRKNYNPELEIFIHGALCACVSGSCLFSSLLGGRSGNRGKCAQPCRKIYNSSFLLSTKELCLIKKIPEIIKLNIDSIKIEGRMRTPYYVATTVSNYRKAIDSYYSNNFKVTPKMMQELETAFSREFTEGKFSHQEVFNPKKSSGVSSIIEKTYEPLVKNIKIEKRKAELNLPYIKEKKSQGKKLIIKVYSKEQAIVAEKYADIIVLDLFNKDFENIKNSSSIPIYAYTPRIMFDSDLDLIKEKIKKLKPEGIFAGNLGMINLLKEFKMNVPIILDYNCNSFNDINLAYLENFNATPIISPELTLEELKQMKNKNFIVFCHGKIILMTLAHNIEAKKLKDEKGFDFEVENIPNGAEIINNKELALFNKARELVKQGINEFYIDTEKLDNFEEVLSIYSQILQGKTPNTKPLEKFYTLGWSKQGVL